MSLYLQLSWIEKGSAIWFFVSGRPIGCEAGHTAPPPFALPYVPPLLPHPGSNAPCPWDPCVPCPLSPLGFWLSAQVRYLSTAAATLVRAVLCVLCLVCVLCLLHPLFVSTLYSKGGIFLSNHLSPEIDLSHASTPLLLPWLPGVPSSAHLPYVIAPAGGQIQMELARDLLCVRLQCVSAGVGRGA